MNYSWVQILEREALLSVSRLPPFPPFSSKPLRPGKGTWEDTATGGFQRPTDGASGRGADSKDLNHHFSLGFNYKRKAFYSSK